MVHQWYGGSYIAVNCIKCFCLNCGQSVLARPSADLSAVAASVAAYDPELRPCAESVLASVHDA